MAPLGVGSCAALACITYMRILYMRVVVVVVVVIQRTSRRARVRVRMHI